MPGHAWGCPLSARKGSRRRPAADYEALLGVNPGQAVDVVLSYDSLASFFAAAPGVNGGCFSPSSEKWQGASIENSTAWRFSWPEGVKMLATLPGFTVPRAKAARARRWSEVDGDEMSMDRYRDGRAFMRQRYKPRCGVKGGRVLRVRVNIGENCKCEASSMLWKAYAAGRLVEELENNGVRCEVVVEQYSSGYAHNGSSWRFSCIVKRPEDPLNLAGVVAACAPWFMRRWVLSVVSLLPGAAWRCAMGRSGPLPPCDDAVTIDHGECLSERAAREWLETAAARVGIVVE
jgi:hypothetical protein